MKRILQTLGGKYSTLHTIESGTIPTADINMTKDKDTIGSQTNADKS